MKHTTILIACIALLLGGCGRLGRAARFTDEEAVARQVGRALQARSFDAMRPLLVSEEEIAQRREELSTLPDSVSRKVIEASRELFSDDYRRDVARAEEKFAGIVGEGLEDSITWENIDYAGYRCDKSAMLGQNVRCEHFEVIFWSAGKAWSFVIPRVELWGNEWRVTGFKFMLRPTGKTLSDSDSWEAPADSSDSWEVTDSTSSE